VGVRNRFGAGFVVFGERPMATILVADDENDLRDLVGGILRQDGHEVLEAATGLEALDLLRKKAIQLLVLDVMLPGMDGYTLMQLWQRERPGGAPVIILSALDYTKSLFSKFPEVKEFVSKPFNPVEFLETVKKILSS
jgi:DNA-binding response OmpR family regulator